MRGIHEVEYLEDFQGGPGARMKTYEKSVGTTLDKGYPIVIRTFAKRHNKQDVNPYDLLNGLAFAARQLRAEFECACLVYVKKDELILLATPNGKAPMYNGNVQKIVSNVTSTVTQAYNDQASESMRFETKTFNLPFMEVNNYFAWRQGRDTGVAMKKEPHGWVELPAPKFKTEKNYVNDLFETHLV